MKALLIVFFICFIQQSNTAPILTGCSNLNIYYYMGYYNGVNYWLCQAGQSIAIYRENLPWPPRPDQCTRNNIVSIRGYVLEGTYIFIDLDTTYFPCLGTISSQFNDVKSLCSGYKLSLYCLIPKGLKFSISKLRLLSGVYSETVDALSNTEYPASANMLFKAVHDEKYLICYLKQGKTYCTFEYTNMNDVDLFFIDFPFTTLQNVHLEEDESILIVGLVMENGVEVNVVVLIDENWRASLIWKNENAKQEQVFISNSLRNVNRIYYYFMNLNDYSLDFYEMYRCYDISYGAKTSIAFTINRIILTNDDTVRLDFYFDEVDPNYNLLMIDNVPVQKGVQYTSDKELTVAIQSSTLTYRYHISNSKEVCSLTIVQCVANCSSCWGKGSATDHKCYFCETGYKPGSKLGNCEKETDELFFDNLLENIRDRCPSDCKACALDPNDATIVKCLSCHPLKPYLTQDGNCLSQCPNGVSPPNQCQRACAGDKVGSPCQSCIAPKDKYYEEACYGKCPLNTFDYLSKCYMKCPIGTTLNLIERKCILCKSPEGLYSKHRCIASCPEGYVASGDICKRCDKFFHGNACVEECPTMTPNLQMLNWDNFSSICNECRGFYNEISECVHRCLSDYNRFNQCRPKVSLRTIDVAYPIDVHHNPLPEMEDMMTTSFDGLSKRDKDSVVNDCYQLILNYNNDLTHYEEAIDKIGAIALYFQLTSSTDTEGGDPQGDKANEVYQKLLSMLSSPEGSSLVHYFPDNMAISSLAILYSTLNKHSNAEKSFATLNGLVAVFFSQYKAFLLPSNKDKIKPGAISFYENDLLISMLYSMSKQTDMLYALPDPSFNQSEMNSLYYLIKNSLITRDEHVKFKLLLEEIVQYAILHKSWLSIQTPNFLMRSSPIDQTTISSIWFVQSNCTTGDVSALIAQMKKDEMKKLICLPSNLISVSPPLEGGNIGVIDYKLYPLLNKNVPVVTKDFISLRLFSKENKLVPLKDLTEPLLLILQRSNNSFNECVFYNEENRTLNNTGCKSESIDDYLICSCDHLTDYGGSIFNPANVFNDVVKLFSQARFIYSFEAFQYLSVHNAVVVYVFSGIVFLYLVGLVITMKYDMKNEEDCFIVFVDKTPKCCSNEEIDEEIELLRTKTATQIMEKKNVIVHKFLGVGAGGGPVKKKLNLAILSNLKIAIEEPPQENIKPETSIETIINNNLSEDQSSESINNNSLTTSISRPSHNRSNGQGTIQPGSQANSGNNTPNNASAPPQVIPGTASSVSISVSSDKNSSKQSEENKHLNKHYCLRYLFLFKEFFLQEYRVCLLILNKEHVYTRSNVLTLITVKLIAMLTTCAIFTQCKEIGVEDTEDDGFTSRMLAVGIGTIITLEIPFTFCEVFLLKAKLPINQKSEREKTRKRVIAGHICVYVFFLMVFVFGFINTTWVSLDSYHNNLSCDYMQDFMLSTTLDYLVYDVMVIVMKAFIYSFLIRADKKTYCQMCLISFISTLPWLFAMQG